ncbi:hypothetical protein [Flavobacterium sp.]|uniref:hypothetical protein n=1 Tax=Flavobacterium sp. TaxID=239 RepID=UPI0025C64B01|nr:hypothetical protein [Flavobacterium sp.]
MKTGSVEGGDLQIDGVLSDHGVLSPTINNYDTTPVVVLNSGVPPKVPTVENTPMPKPTPIANFPSPKPKPLFTMPEIDLLGTIQNTAKLNFNY